MLHRGGITLGNITEKYIEKYIKETIPDSSNILQMLEQYAKEYHIPIIQPEVAQFIRVILNIKKPKNILEIGTAIGYSAIVMAETIDDVKIITIERREDMIDIAKGNIRKAGYENRIEIMGGDAEDVLPCIDGEFDMIFLDAAKGQYMDFLNLCLDKLNNDGVIISDNVLYKGMVANDDLVVRRKKTIVKRMRQYLDYICKDKKFTSCVLPLGDGVALTYKGGK